LNHQLSHGGGRAGVFRATIETIATHLGRVKFQKSDGSRFALVEAPSVNRRHRFLPILFLQLPAYFNGFIERFIPGKCCLDPDQHRRARLIVHFGVQGALFGAAYAVFYQSIGHRYGAEVIVVCSAIFAAVPWVLRRTGSLGFAGHLVVGTMAAGFTQLALIEGGIHSHAISWLASVPLCALLILGARPAMVWTATCFLVGSVIAIAELQGLDLEPLYDPRWHNLVDAAGNLGIIVFLFILGLVFETSRATAFDRMQASLGELAASNEELAHLNKEKTEFLGIAAHDLRNPLTAVIGMGELLTLNRDPDVVECAGLISKSGRRMLELIKDLLDANAIEEGRYGSQLDPCDLRPLVIASIEQSRLSAARKEIALDFHDGSPAWAQANRKATLQILDNLLSNALKYSPPGSRVTLSLKNDGACVEFIVRDEGPGISAEDQRKLFLKFSRLSARPTGGESSVGLGLSIVKRLAEGMGGTVTCESALGSGTAFILRLRSIPCSEVAPPSRFD
jgi:signal transduction histidine kinase